MSAKDNSDQRLVYFDYLRIFAAFSIMLLHIASLDWSWVDVNTFDWKVLNAYDGFGRFAVNVFVMMSGVLFLNRDIPIKKIYVKYILRIVTAYLFWAIFYSCIYVFIYPLMGFEDQEQVTLERIIDGIIYGNYHMWFLPMIVGLYMIQPILRRFISSDKIVIYFLMLACIFALAIPELVSLSRDFANEFIANKIQETYYNLIDHFYLKLLLGYTLFFVGGYYIEKLELSSIQRKVIYLLGVIGMFFTIYLSQISAIRNQAPNTKYLENLNINCMMYALGVFVWFKYNVHGNEKFDKYIKVLAKYSFGAYLVHPFVIEILDLKGLHAMTYDIRISTLIVGVIVFVLSFGISAILNQIPILKKYIV